MSSFGGALLTLTEVLILAAVGLWPLAVVTTIAVVAAVRRPGRTGAAMPNRPLAPMGRPPSIDLGRRVDLAGAR
ncbi:MAG TPA: hypothetical protein VM491_00445 [Burkholderiaceae bacterium]|jgi:hypothetical protein|nr:hypothetical protein [Burkholderiaceae bacterium]